jgi:hypothetical protein
MELPAVGATPTVALLDHVVAPPSVLTIVHEAGVVGGNVVVVNPSATGGVFVDAPVTVIYPVWFEVLLPFAFETVNETLYVPAVLNVTLGFCVVLVPGVPPWKVHEYEVGEPVDVLVNCTL